MTAPPSAALSARLFWPDNARRILLRNLKIFFMLRQRRLGDGCNPSPASAARRAGACGWRISPRRAASRSVPPRALLPAKKGVRPEIRQQVLEVAKTANYGVPTAVAGQKVILAASSAAMIDYVRNQFTLYVLEGLRSAGGHWDLRSSPGRSPTGNEESGGAQGGGRRRPRCRCPVPHGRRRGHARRHPRLRQAGGPAQRRRSVMRLSSVTPCNRSARGWPPSTDRAWSSAHPVPDAAGPAHDRAALRGLEGRLVAHGWPTTTDSSFRSRTGCRNWRLRPLRRGSASAGSISRLFSPPATACRGGDDGRAAAGLLASRATFRSWAWTTYPGGFPQLRR